MNYQQIKNQQPVLRECFFSFSTKQFNESMKEHNLEGKKIYRGIGGLYGTKEGIKELMTFYDKLNEQIGKECNPQEVYNYEFDNHECSISYDDTEVMKMMLGYFTLIQCLDIERKYQCYTIIQLMDMMKEDVS